MFNVLVINGPNMNLLGSREPELYGDMSLNELEVLSIEKFNGKLDQEWFQSNFEGEIIDRIHLAIKNNTPAILINPAAYSHYSIAILDALKCFTGYKVEVHLTDIGSREAFRNKSVTATACDEFICGMGIDGYIMALTKIYERINRINNGLSND